MKKVMLLVLVGTMISPLFSQLFNTYRGMGLSINTNTNPLTEYPFATAAFGLSGENALFIIFEPDEGRYRLEPSIGYRGMYYDDYKFTIISFGFKLLKVKSLSEFTNSYFGISFKPNITTLNGEQSHKVLTYSAIYGLERKYEKLNFGCELLYSNVAHCPDGHGDDNHCVTLRELETKIIVRFFK